MTRKIVTVTHALPAPALRAMVRLKVGQEMTFHTAFVLQAAAIQYLRSEMAAGGWSCPLCGNLWSTREKREACDHVGGDPQPETEKALRYCISEAEKLGPPL